MVTILCPKCRKEYTFDESIIPPDVELIECKVCKAQFPLEVQRKITFPEDHLPVESIEEAPAGETGTVTPLESDVDWYPLDSNEEESSPEPAEGIHTSEEPVVPRAGLSVDTEDSHSGWEEETPHIELTDEVEFGHRSEHRMDFSAERYRYLNVRAGRAKGKMLFYGLIVLLTLIFSYYLFYAG